MKPMLAANVRTSDDIKLPALASPKLDGIRGIVKDGVVLSRSLKPIPNLAIQTVYGRSEFNGVDGEFIVGKPTASDVYRKTNSKVMTINDDAQDVSFYVFDMWNIDGAYHKRHYKIPRSSVITTLENVSVHTLDEVNSMEQHFTSQGFEGMMLRNAYAPYKFGRSTVSQAYLLKIKRFVDAEVAIIGMTELMRNGNELVYNELGYASRSSHQENLIPSGMMGALKVVCLTNGWEFEIGTGFTTEQRKTMWQDKESFVGQFAKYKYFPVGMKDLPRHPVFLGIRNPLDM